jgi:hypothetical protein
MTLEQARRELTRLNMRYPHQHFVIVGEIGEAARTEREAVHGDAREA